MFFYLFLIKDDCQSCYKTCCIWCGLVLTEQNIPLKYMLEGTRCDRDITVYRSKCQYVQEEEIQTFAVMDVSRGGVQMHPLLGISKWWCEMLFPHNCAIGGDVWVVEEVGVVHVISVCSDSAIGDVISGNCGSSGNRNYVFFNDLIKTLKTMARQFINHWNWREADVRKIQVCKPAR